MVFIDEELEVFAEILLHS